MKLPMTTDQKEMVLEAVADFRTNCLQRCKAEEKKLKERCREILNPTPTKEPGLFGES